MRTCVGCRATAPQGDLLRIAVVDDALVADPRRRASGRGGYVHQRTDCLKAAGKGGLARAFKRNVSRAQLDAIATAIAASQGGANAVERAPHLTLQPVSTSPVDPSTAQPSEAGRASHGA